LVAHIRRCRSSTPSATGRAGFTEPATGIDGISQRMFIVTLRGPDRDGILTRTVGQVRPAHVSCDLTDVGRSLLHATQPLLVWSIENLSAVDHARTEFDNRPPP
jgi:DNA-binding HxlR family transcriptional regulator